MNDIQERAKALLDQAEKLLRDADDRVEVVAPTLRREARRQRNAINAACNALFRATKP